MSFLKAILRPRRPPSRHGLTIFMYHAVVPVPLAVPDWCFVEASSFRRQIRYLRRHFAFVPLLDAVDRLQRGELRRPTAVLTFDDGFQNGHDVALPILRRERVPATFFLTTGFVDTDDTPWFCRLHRALAETGQRELVWNAERFDLSGRAARARSSAALKARLKRLAPPGLQAELHRLLLALGDDPARPVEANSPYRMLDLRSIAAMAASGVAEFGAHTHTHPILRLLPPAEQRREIERSLALVSGWTRRPCRVFAYPNGAAEDYTADTVALLAAGGVQAAVTAVEGPNDETTPPLELRRYGIGAGMDRARFVKKVRPLAKST